VYINNSKDKEKVVPKPVVPVVTKFPGQFVTNKIQFKPTNKFPGSRNDVFRFTSITKPVNTTYNLVAKNSVTVQESHKKTTQPENTAAIATGNTYHLKSRYISNSPLTYFINFFTARKRIIESFHPEVNSNGLVKIMLILPHSQQLLALNVKHLM